MSFQDHVCKDITNIVSDAEVIYGDGTFFICPGLFKQVYILHTIVRKTMIACAYFLLPDIEQVTYFSMLQYLQSICPISATRFQTDFEMAVMNAFKQFNPNAKVSGCFFHFTQNIWRKVSTHSSKSISKDSHTCQCLLDSKSETSDTLQ